MLSLQAFAGFFKIHYRYYPFMDYPMYSEAHYKGEPVHVRWLIYGVGEDSSEVRIFPEDLHMGYFQFEQAAVSIIKQLKLMKYRIQDIRNYANAQGRKLVRIRVEEEAVMITDEGLRNVPNRTVAVIGIDSTEERS